MKKLPEEQPVLASRYSVPMINDALPLTPQRQIATAYSTPSPTPARASRVSYPISPVKIRGQARHSTGSDLARGFQGPPITNNEECRPNLFTPKKNNAVQQASAYLTPSPTPVRSRPSYPVKPEEHTRHLLSGSQGLPITNDEECLPNFFLPKKSQVGNLTPSEHMAGPYLTPPAPASRISYPLTPIKYQEHTRHLMRGFQGPPNTNDEECRPNPFTPKKNQNEKPAQQASAYLTPSPTPVRASNKSEQHTRHILKGYQGPLITNDEEFPSNPFTPKIENQTQLLTPPVSSAPRIKAEHKPVSIKSEYRSVLLTPPVIPLKATTKPLSINTTKKETYVETTQSPTKETPTYLTLDGKFSTGEQLLPYQLNDVFLLVNRELGEKVCRSNSWNNTGYLLAYDMGLGKTVVSIALSILNPPGDEYEGAKATLVIVPNKGMMEQWKSEIHKFAPHLDVCMYDSVTAQLRPNADIVLLTHTQLRNQHRTKLTNPKTFAKCSLYQYCWYRIIIDEAHFCRNPATKLAEAIWDVNKRHGLCLTGTPVQNSIVDFYPLFRFLGVEYENIHDLSTFERKIYRRRQKGRICDPRAQEILDTVKESFCIFRSKVDPETGEVLVNLPPREDMNYIFSFTPGERKIYQFVKRHPLQILAKLTRLRQACDHPVFLAQGLKDDLVYADEGEDYDFMASSLVPGTTNKLPKNVRMIFERGDRYQSSKLRAMLRILKKHEGQKTIVFTHFTSMIKPIGNALDRAGIVWTEYTGGMTSKQQREALKELAEDDQYSVIVISIMAGSTGLNITSCNNVIFLEPWWNPFAEEQAISRVHRIGQTLPVTVYRLITKDSLEESILATQAMKYDMASGIYGFEVDSKTQEAWLAGP